MMLQRLPALFIALSAILLTASFAAAHCEVPCGIYDDQLRAVLIAEHATTVEKSMKKIVELSGASPVNYNQLVRWVANKDEHAEKIQHIVWQYFMTQRIKPDAAKYSRKVTVLHKMLKDEGVSTPKAFVLYFNNDHGEEYKLVTEEVFGAGNVTSVGHTGAADQLAITTIVNQAITALNLSGSGPDYDVFCAFTYDPYLALIGRCSSALSRIDEHGVRLCTCYFQALPDAYLACGRFWDRPFLFSR